MYTFLKKIHSNLDFYIPHRYREGYGVSKAGIDFAKENGFTLIISLDCGIKSIDLIAYAKELKIDFVVCDHHLPDTELPPAPGSFKFAQPARETARRQQKKTLQKEACSLVIVCRKCRWCLKKSK